MPWISAAPIWRLGALRDNGAVNDSVPDARNFRQVHENLLTAGQPNETQLADATRHGVKVVINLALHNDPRYSLGDEVGCVRGLGMDYVHIPVPFNAPTEDNLRAFIALRNYRVTAFVGLYRVLCEGWAADKAFEPMRSVWEPDAVWTQFISNMLQSRCEQT
jgi:beta-lactamase/hydrolase/phosphatase family protein